MCSGGPLLGEIVCRNRPNDPPVCALVANSSVTSASRPLDPARGAAVSGNTMNASCSSAAALDPVTRASKSPAVRKYDAAARCLLIVEVLFEPRENTLFHDTRAASPTRKRSCDAHLVMSKRDHLPPDAPFRLSIRRGLRQLTGEAP